MTRYANQTQVDPMRSRVAIEHTLKRYGATQIAYGWEKERAVVQFAMRQRRIKFILPLPSERDDAIRLTATGRKRMQNRLNTVYEQAVRQSWRALLLTITAKLESVESGIEEFEEAFMAQLVLPNNKTMADEMLPRIRDAFEHNAMPNFPLLEGPK